MTQLRSGSATDVGMVRSQNEDALLVDEPLFAVADGMGGHAAGEVASEAAIETLDVAFKRNPTLDGLVEAVQEANRRVWHIGQSESDKRGMGTTVAAAALVDDNGEDTLAVANVGDSRVYLLRDGDLTQITEDHSLVEELVRGGQLSPEEAQIHPQRHVVTRVLGMAPDIDVDLFPVIPYRGDRLLLASDGLFNEVADEAIAQVLRQVREPDAAAHELVAQAKTAGGADNITVIVVDVVDDDGRSESASAALAADKTTVVPRADGAARAAPDRAQPPPTPPPPTPPPSRSAAPADIGLAPARPRRITGRVIAFIAVVVVLVIAAAGAVVYAARSTYYVGLQGDDVLIYKGRPGGLLWFKPTLAARTGHTTADVPADRLEQVQAGKEEPSLAAARRYTQNLFAEAAAARSTTTTTTTATPPTSTATTATSTP